MAGRQWWSFRNVHGRFRRTLLNVYVHEDFHEWIRAKSHRLTGVSPSDRAVLSIVKTFLLHDTQHREDITVWHLRCLHPGKGVYLSLSAQVHGELADYVDTNNDYYRIQQDTDVKVTT